MVSRLTLLLVPAALFAGQVRYARLGEFQGNVEVQIRAPEPWMPAQRNLPLVESTWVRTGSASRVEIELDEGSTWRLGADSHGALADYTRLATGQRVTLLTLDRGIGYFTGEAPPADSLVVSVPGAQVTVTRGARLRLEAQERISEIFVIEGSVRFSSPAAELDLHEGQTARVEPANPARFFLNREVTAQELDRWSEERDKALETSTSVAYTVQRYGLVDLDGAGEWTQTDDLGAVWKPKSPQGWLPFQQGRWRWYDGLGYTWVSDEPWGWLPYHYGRWMRKGGLGWVWAPGQSTVFKPGEVYWLRGNRMAGWGPLAPGEQWTPGDAQPAQFLNANTVFAEFSPEAVVIDPAGFTARPKEPLAVAVFAAALPSPAFPAAKLDILRPIVAARTRVAPAVEGGTFESASRQPTVILPPQQPPVVVVQDPPPPPPDPPVMTYPVAVPVPILIVDPAGNPDYRTRPRVPVAQTGGTPRPAQQGGSSTPPSGTPSAQAPSSTPPPKPVGRTIPIVTPTVSGGEPPTHKPAGAPRIPVAKPPAASQPSPPPAAPPSPPPAGTQPSSPTSTPAPAAPPTPAPRKPSGRKDSAAAQPGFIPFTPVSKKMRSSGEAEHLNRVVQDLSAANFSKAIADLDGWTKSYRDSEWQADRLHYYMQAFDGLNQPERVLDAGAQLIARGLPFRNTMQVVSVLYLTSINYQKVSAPSREQSMVATAAATDLLSVLPESFRPANRPADTTEDDWTQAKTHLETLANSTLNAARHARR